MESHTISKALSKYVTSNIDIILKRCCNTCDDVKEAYRLRRWALPDLATIEQCKDDDSVERTNQALKEGCQIYGYMEVNRVTYNIEYYLKYFK